MKIVYILILIMSTGMYSFAQIHTEFEVGGKCGMCKDRIEKIAKDEPGVMEAFYNLQDKELHVTLDTTVTPIEDIKLSLAMAGHDAPPYKAPDVEYENLPGCCLYRDNSSVQDHSGEMEHSDQDAEEISGTVLGQAEGSDESVPVIGANVKVAGTDRGTVTDLDGNFSISATPHQELIISAVGYQTVALHAHEADQAQVTLTEGVVMEEVEITERTAATGISVINPVKVEKISRKELERGACCNLSESFETNPTVDVSIADAITGTRQIRMLGLDGKYTQLLREAMPATHGLAVIQGLTYVPGVWVDAIYLNKGIGSVVQGYESITGQINYDLVKPENLDPTMINLYVGEMGRIEGNVTSSFRLNEHTTSSILAHGVYNRTNHDQNNDNFKDHPLRESMILLNRYQFEKDSWRSQLGIKITHMNDIGGELNYSGSTERENLWGMHSDTRRYEGWIKVAKFFEQPQTSWGNQLSAVRHDVDAGYGERIYLAEQTSFYYNSVFNSIFGTSDHSYKTGINFSYHNISEEIPEYDYSLEEISTGAFFEYTYQSRTLSVIAGLRGDYHNTYDFFVTPRLHVKYNPWEKTALRFSTGKGYRTPYVIAENLRGLASARQFVFQPEGDYFEMEEAWNTGLNITQNLKLLNRPMTLTADLYYTIFENRIVADYDLARHSIHIYEVAGNSDNLSFQAQMDYELLPRLDLRVAYRYVDNTINYLTGDRRAIWVAENRGFVNLTYTTVNDWMFSATGQLVGEQRVPESIANDNPLGLGDYSPAYGMINVQVSKSWNDKIDVYVGSENLLDYTQEEAIISADNPFHVDFDATNIYAPVMGRNIYAGIRWKFL